MNPLETYIRELYDIRSTGAAVAETAYYPALSNLLNEVGKTLKPKVRCIINLKNRGAGLPDGGLFTPDQFQKSSEAEPLAGTDPARGVIEVKSASGDAWLTADGEQVSRYWGKYRQVLVTNLRDFLLVGQDAEGNQVKLEAYRLAPNEAEFWKEAAHPRRLAAVHGERFIEYLKRVMLQAAPLAAPKEVAWFLASYARDAKARMEGVALPALDTLRAALEEALGLKFEGTKADPGKGEHFFRSTLVQTIFYGVFSAWVLWDKKHPRTDRKARFNWRETVWYLRVPMIRALFEQLATPAKLGPLGLVEVLEWTETTLNRVDRASFFDQFEEGHAVQYFYEPFLEAFDPQLRKDLGVWYTPPEIVQYMVARVDTVLRQELDLPDGLADPRVYVLDPCCGTGAYLVEVLKRITATLRGKGDDALVGADVKKAALSRVFGFEILPAPFVVAHLQVGLYVQSLGAPLAADANERAGVYLTNALTGWEPPQGPKHQLIFPELAEERDAAEEVKRDKPILVILGNPPYNAFAGVSPQEEQGLVEPYKEGLISRWGIKKFNLDELYVRFFRLAERRIAEKTGKGVVCYISNHSWVSDPSFVVLRQHLLASFDRFWIENMHGNRQMSEYAPDGRTSETIFAIPGFSPGIQQGVVISLWVKSGKESQGVKVLFRDDLDAPKSVERRSQLLESLNEPDFDSHYQSVQSKRSNRLSFRPFKVSDIYLSWPSMSDLCNKPPFPAFMESRRFALIDIDRVRLEEQMRRYYDPNINWETLRSEGHRLTENAARFNAKNARDRVIVLESFNIANIHRYALRPFENRWCYFSELRPLWNEPRPELWTQYWPGNSFLVTRLKTEKYAKGSPIYLSSYLVDCQSLARNVAVIPFRLRSLASRKRKGKQQQQEMFTNEQEQTPITANHSGTARTYLAALGLPDPDADPETAGLIWMHALAVGYAPAYLMENADGIRQDWPRVPLPDTADALRASARLGREIAALLDTGDPGSGR